MKYLNTFESFSKLGEYWVQIVGREYFEYAKILSAELHEAAGEFFNRDGEKQTGPPEKIECYLTFETEEHFEKALKIFRENGIPVDSISVSERNRAYRKAKFSWKPYRGNDSEEVMKSRWENTRGKRNLHKFGI